MGQFRLLKGGRGSSQSRALATIACGLALCGGAARGQGELSPPAGGPGRTFRTLGQIESRRPISRLPCSIDAPGAYYLTTNLTARAGQGGLVIAADDVDIDLNGFALRGAAGTYSGITYFGSRVNVAIHGGSIVEWGASAVSLRPAKAVRLWDLVISSNGWGGAVVAAVDLGSEALVRDCLFANNHGDGLYASTGCLVLRCRFQGNDGDGIETLHGSLLAASTASRNAGVGCLLASGSLVSGCGSDANAGRGFDLGRSCVAANACAIGNAGDGFYGSDGCVMTRCAARANAAKGITGNGGLVVRACLAHGNGGNGIDPGNGSLVAGCTARENGGQGIYVGSKSYILDNNCSDNRNAAMAGIYVSSSDNRIEGNHCSHNDRGLYVAGTGNVVVRNSASFNTGASGNIFVTPGNTDAVRINTPGSAFSSTEPWANFTF